MDEVEQRVMEKTRQREKAQARDQVLKYLDHASAEIVKAQRLAKVHEDADASSELSYLQDKLKRAWDRLKP